MILSFAVHKLVVWFAFHAKTKPFKKAGWSLYPAGGKHYLELWMAPWNSQRAINCS